MHTYKARVARWVDGDVVDLMVDLGFGCYFLQRIRLIGIDCPKQGEPGYEAAVAHCEFYAPAGSQLVVETEKGNHGTWLGKVTLASGIDLSETLVSVDLARRWSIYG